MDADDLDLSGERCPAHQAWDAPVFHEVVPFEGGVGKLAGHLTEARPHVETDALDPVVHTQTGFHHLKKQQIFNRSG